MMTKHNSWHS